jgi:hypothetical protein
MQAMSTPESDRQSVTGDMVIAPGDLQELARWVPKKEMALLTEICERARLDPGLTRSALLLCSAYGELVSRMLDQDPFPAVTRKIAERLQLLREESGL